jgi:hypothetical protein
VETTPALSRAQRRRSPATQRANLDSLLAGVVDRLCRVRPRPEGIATRLEQLRFDLESGTLRTFAELEGALESILLQLAASPTSSARSFDAQSRHFFNDARSESSALCALTYCPLCEALCVSSQAVSQHVESGCPPLCGASASSAASSRAASSQSPARAKRRRRVAPAAVLPAAPAAERIEIPETQDDALQIAETEESESDAAAAAVRIEESSSDAGNGPMAATLRARAAPSAAEARAALQPLPASSDGEGGTVPAASTKAPRVSQTSSSSDAGGDEVLTSRVANGATTVVRRSAFEIGSDSDDDDDDALLFAAARTQREKRAGLLKRSRAEQREAGLRKRSRPSSCAAARAWSEDESDGSAQLDEDEPPPAPSAAARAARRAATAFAAAAPAAAAAAAPLVPGSHASVPFLLSDSEDSESSAPTTITAPAAEAAAAAAAARDASTFANCGLQRGGDDSAIESASDEASDDALAPAREGEIGSRALDAAAARLMSAILPHLRLIGDLRAAGERVDFIPIYAQKNGAALRSGQKAGACVCQGMCVRNCPCKLLNMPCHPSRCRCDFTCCKNTEAASTAARAKRKSKQKYGGKRGRGRKKKSARR